VYDDLPLNHPLRGLHRTLALICAVLFVLFGVIGLVVTATGDGIGSRSSTAILGLGGNGAFSVFMIVLGLIIVLGSLAGGRVAHLVYLASSGLLLVVGLATLALLDTDLNVLGFTMATCIAVYLAGTLLFLNGTYTKVGTPELAAAKDLERHGGRLPSHVLQERRATTPVAQPIVEPETP
jgi:hypothetical protein